jgi:DNA-binding CsgD family transcriptional regulator
MLLQGSALHSGSIFVQVAKYSGFLRSFCSTGISESGRVVLGRRRVSILIIAWSMCAAGNLMLELMQVFLWFHERPSPVCLLMSLACLSAAATAMTELSLMHASSTAISGEVLRGQNLAVFFLLVPLVWAVYLHLGTGRRWLALVITMRWAIAIVINFTSPDSVVFAKIASLLILITPREQEVMRCVITGDANKRIAGKLGIAEKTGKIHRSRVMKKLEATSVAALPLACQQAKVEATTKTY